MKIKIFLADDQYLMLEGIKAILKHEPEIEIVGTAQDGHSAVTQVIKLQPDLVLIDIEMPKMNGIVATKYICKHVPDTRVIVLSSHKEQSYITEALKAGASGYLLKDSLIEDLKQAIHSSGTNYVYAEGKLLTQTVARRQTVNIVKYPKKSLYLQRYRKSIYKPALKRQRLQIKQNFSNILVRNSVNGISKASLAPIFDSPTAQEILLLYRTKSQNRRFYHQPKFNRQRYLQRIILMLIAIASFVLSIIAF
jgi:DNA-binding NarL/FixJ family response regulator